MLDVVALLFGAAIIALFSYERFNQATYQDGRQLERLVDLLSPDTLRARRVVRQAYLFYAGALVLIYFFLCAYAELLPFLGGPDLGAGTVGAERLPVAVSDSTAETTTGFNPRGDGINIDWSQALSTAAEPEPPRQFFDIGIDPNVSLTVALIIIGLAPSFPILRRFEDWMRVSAHQLAGIPTIVIGIRDDLRGNALNLVQDSDSAGSVQDNRLLIPRGDWERMYHYSQVAEGKLNAPEAFRNDIELILAASAWFLERKLKVDDPQERERFDRLAGRLSERKDVLIQQLDEKTDFNPGESPAERVGDGSAPMAAAAEHGDSMGNGEVKRAGWERLAKQADELADDICTLLALYKEHGVIVVGDHNPDREESDGAARAEDGTRRDPVHQQRGAEKKLRAFLGVHGAAAAGERSPSYTALTSLWTLGVMLVVTLVWSLVPGRFEEELQWGTPGNPYVRAMAYSFFAFNSYFIPVLVALVIRDGARRAHRWRNMWWRHWTVRLPQALGVLVASWVVATWFMLALNIWQLGLDKGWDANERLSSLRAAFEFSGPATLRGSILALVVVYVLDAYAAGRAAHVAAGLWRRSVRWALSAAFVMAVAGALTRFISLWASAVNAAAKRPFPDAIDLGLIAYGAMYSALLGFSVVFFVSEALYNQTRSQGRKGGRSHADERREDNEGKKQEGDLENEPAEGEIAQQPIPES